MREASGKLLPLSSPQTLEDHTAREHIHQSEGQKLEKPSEHKFSDWLNVENSERTGFLSHTDDNAASGRSVDSNETVSLSSLWSSHVRAVGLKPPTAPAIQQRTATEPCHAESSPCSERRVQPACRPDGRQVPKLPRQSPPPPLPPKKYAVTSVPPPQRNDWTPDVPLAEAVGPRSSGLPTLGGSAAAEPASAAGARVSDRRLKDAPHVEERGGSTPNHTSGASANHFPADTGAVAHAPCRPEVDSACTGPRETMSLTTYFSVDSCMTDTYRLKYHQRPKLCSPESSGFCHQGSHSQSAGGLGPVLQRGLGSKCPSEHRCNPSIRCNR